MKQLKLIQNEQEAKNNFLLTNLKTIANKLNASELIKEVDGRLYYQQNEVEEFCQQTALELNFRSNFTQIYLVTETSSYTVNVIGINEFIKDLESTLKLDWSKKTYSEIKNSSENYETWKLVPKFKTGSPRITPELDTICIANIESAKQGLANCEANYTLKDKAAQIKCLQKTIEYWTEMLKKHSYTEQDLKERKEQEFIDNNHHLEAISKYCDGSIWISKRGIKELFDKYSVEYTSDIDVFLALYYANEINDPEATYKTKWNNSLKPYEKYLQWLQIEYKDKKITYTDTYLKKDGKPKQMSHRQRERCHSDEQDLHKLNKKIDFIIKNEFKVKEFINE